MSKSLSKAVDLVKAKDLEGIKREFKTTPLDVVGSLLRTVFVAPPGKKLVICDLSAIEGRGTGYVARDKEIVKIFEKNLDPYLDFASRLYNIPYELLTIINEKGEHKPRDNDAKEKRQIAKPGFLGCCYQLSGGEERIDDKTGDKVFTGLMGYGRAMGIPVTKEDADRSVEIYRESYKDVVKCWSDLEEAAKRCIWTGKEETVGPVRFEMFQNVLRMVLPSGRCLHYLEPKIVEREWFGKMKKTIECWGMDQKLHIWTRIYTYGGKLFENAVQAISRDILCCGMLEATAMGFFIVMTCHDEIVAEQPIDSPLGIKELREAMIKKPIWGNDQLILDAAGFESQVYRKD